MFGLFSVPDIEHPQLGVLRWHRGHWRGSISLPGHEAVPLILGGSRKGPGIEALAEALALPVTLDRWQSRIGSALFEHYEPYAEAQDEGKQPAERRDLPEIRSSADAVRHAELRAILIAPLDGLVATEFCYRVAWDIEHTLGARIQGGQWVELCGSTLVP